MADEENPFGGGPFGQGPFGPLIPVAAAAVAAFSMVVTTTSVPVPRTLFYQAKIAPPPQEPAEAGEINAATSITTSGVRTKTLHYQSKIYGIAPPVVAVVDVTIDKWQQPFTRAPARGPTETGLYTPFVPQIAPQPTADEWLPRWRGPPNYLPVPQGGSPFVPKEAVLENTQTPDRWLQAWRGPPNYNPAPVGGSPFIPREAVLENTVTPDAWMPRWQKAVPSTRLNLSDVTYTQPPAAVSNLTTTLEWMPAWSGTKRPLLSLAGGVVNVPIPSNLTTTLEWQVAWRGPPRPTPAPQGGAPFVPKEAVLENTVTPDKWLVRFQGAVPIPPVHHTQPVLGYPYAAASNLTTTLEWMPAWRGPPSYTPIKVQVPPFVPKADIVDQVTPDKWLQAWRGPPRAVPAQAGGSPFVPKEAVLENTVTPDKWLVRFAKAVPVPPARPTQPFLGYPYTSQAIVVPYDQWWHQPLSRPAQRPSVHAKPYQPFVPKEAVAENTQTPDKWLQRWQAPPAYRPLKVQALPFVPKVPVQDVVGPDKWHRDLGRAAAKRPVTHTQPGWSYAPVAVENTVTIDKWRLAWNLAAKTPKPIPTQPFYGYPYEQAAVCIPAFQVASGFQFDAFQTCAGEQDPAPETEAFVTAQVIGMARGRRTLFYQALIHQPYPVPFVDVGVTPDKWMRPLGVAVKRPPVHRTQTSFGYPYVQAAIEPPWAVTVTTNFVFSRTLHYQSRVEVPQVIIDANAIEGGPADEPERVICLLQHSRVAVVPEASREATVLVDLRVATVPEESRTVETLLSERDEESNLFTTLPCAVSIVVAPEPGDAFDSGFQDDGYQ